MKFATMLSSVCAACVLSGAVHAQADSSAADPTTRAAVKADAKAAEKSGSIPRGDASANENRDTTPSVANRQAVKASTKAAEKKEQLSRGEASHTDGRQDTNSVATRASVKADAKAAEKDHEIPRGESQVNN